MKIKDYSFGKISIGDKTYTSDLIICPDIIIYPWYRIEGHILQLEDLNEIIRQSPEIMIIGTGYYGRMKIDGELLQILNRKAIIVHLNKTPEAVSLFNNLYHLKKTIACLHLTC